eukprot:jgi/Orpsp1_1/1175369/evm.model.c7180000053591.1
MGENLFDINIYGSYFNGKFSNSCLHISEALYLNVTSSKFLNGENYRIGGGGMRIEKSNNIFINDCIFNNFYSKYDGGVLYIYNTDSVFVNNIEVNNITAIQKGSFLYGYNGKNNKSNINLIKVSEWGAGYIENQYIKFGGLIASIEGNINLYIKDFNGGWLNGGKGAFTLNDISTIDIDGINLSNVYGNYTGGVLLTSYDEKIGSRFNINNGNFNTFIQYSKLKSSSSFIWSTENIDISIKNFIYSENSCKIELNEVYLTNVRYEIPGILFYNHGITASENFKYVIKYEKGVIKINETSISSISTCSLSILCKKYVEDKDINELINIGSYTNLTITNSIIYDYNGFKGINAKYPSYITIDNLTVQFCYYEMGFIEIDSNNEIYGYYEINNSLFDMNYGKKGSVVHIEEINDKASIIFNNSIFNYNYAIVYGGIIYSNSKSTNKYVSFNDCKFSALTSLNGYISYSISKESEPYFSNADELRKNKKYFETNPVELRLSNESVTSISLKSGSIITNTLK